ncbi:MAG: choice-of-anchor D domain-containing protein [Candidatus Thermoplasmatota archaeon]|nr:choice-of-anchor D domain-containing protein [Candidatus Thermoplasmatota archaeon]
MQNTTKQTLQKAIAICTTLLLFTTIFSLSSVAVTRREGKDVTQLSTTQHFSLPRFEKTTIDDIDYDSILIEDTQPSGNAGEPRLPTRGVSLLLPQGCTVKDITIMRSNKQHLGSGYLIQPVSEQVPLSAIESVPHPVPNEHIYASTKVFPADIVTQVGIFSYRGYQLVALNIHPVQYIPASGDLSYFTDLEITVHLQPTDSDHALFRGLEKDQHHLGTLVENTEALATYSPQPKGSSSDPYELLIITTDALVTGFLSLKDYHTTHDLTTVITTVEDIYNTYPGVDEAEKIRNYIIDKYASWGLEYVLLAGDHELVPARRLWVQAKPGGNAEFTPSDMYYACLDGTYDYDGDSIFGEPTDGENGSDVDLVADVYVGRATVANLSEAQNFVTKTIQYMNYADNESYLENMLLAAQQLGFGGQSEWASTMMDELIDGSTNHGYTTVGIPSSYYTIDTLYDSDETTWTKQQLIDKINQNVHLINHLGHANYNANMKINLTDVLSLSNQHPCFIYSQGCRSGAFDNPSPINTGDCIAEYFTAKASHAAFAGIWNARFGYGAFYITDSASQRFHREFIDALFGEGIRSLGEANHDSKHDNLYRVNEQSMRYIYYGLNLFGDPAVSLHLTHLTGENIVVKHDDTTVCNTGVLNIGSLAFNQKSKIMTFTIENMGTQPLKLTGTPSIQVQGPDADQYHVSQFPTITLLQPGSSTTFKIQFTPLHAGRRTTQVIIPNDDPYAAPYTFTMHGRWWNEAYNANTGVWYHTIQDAVDEAADGQRIYVPDGHHYLSAPITIEKAVTLQSYHGAEVTTLNGSDTHQRCLLLNHPRALVSGFTITGGYVTDTDSGGGIAILPLGGTVNSCILRGNRAGNGGAVYVEDNGQIRNCYIEGNNAHTNGGGIAVLTRCTIDWCTITGNTAWNGGGIHSLDNTRITHSSISDNIAVMDGGGLYANSSLFLENCLIHYNIAFRGGAVYLGGDDNSTTQRFSLCTIADNEGVKIPNNPNPFYPSGGGINAQSSPSFITVTNSIVYNNTHIGPDTDEETGTIYTSNYMGTLSITYTCTVPIPSSGIGNIEDDPHFIGLGSLLPYALKPVSPCVNKGNPNDIPLPLLDLAHNLRLIGGRVDMGAYELQKELPPTWTTHDSASP